MEVLNSQLETANLDLKEKQKQIDDNDADKRDLNFTIENLKKQLSEHIAEKAAMEMLEPEKIKP